MMACVWHMPSTGQSNIPQCICIETYKLACHASHDQSKKYFTGHVPALHGPSMAV